MAPGRGHLCCIDTFLVLLLSSIAHKIKAVVQVSTFLSTFGDSTACSSSCHSKLEVCHFCKVSNNEEIWHLGWSETDQLLKYWKNVPKDFWPTVIYAFAHWLVCIIVGSLLGLVVKSANSWSLDLSLLWVRVSLGSQVRNKLCLWKVRWFFSGCSGFQPPWMDEWLDISEIYLKGQ